MSISRLRYLLLIFVCISLCNTAHAKTPPIVQAVQSNHIPLLVQLVKGGTDVNVINAIGRTAAHYAVEQKNVRALALLLNNGADVNLIDNDGNTLLDIWQKHKNKEMLRLLHNAGAKPSFSKVEVQQPVIVPAINKKPRPHDLLLKNKIKIAFVAQIVAFLSRTVSFSPENEKESRNLWQAAANNDRAGAERLLIEGADAMAKNITGKMPFDIAVKAEHAAVAAILLKAVAGINGKDEKGWRPMHWAIVADEWDLVKAFIREGADIFAGHQQQSGVDIARQMGSEAQLIEAFIAVKGVDATLEGIGISDLDTLIGAIGAARNGQTDLVKFLVERGADLNYKSIGWSPLMAAVSSGRLDLVKFLVEKGADINARNRSSWTALLVAAGKGHTEIVKFLVEKGADINVKRFGYSALSRARMNGDTATEKFLVERGADLF